MQKYSTLPLTAGAATLAFFGFTGSAAKADPPPPDFPLPDVFCFRFTDMERLPGDAEGDAFVLEFEVLNWTGTQASGLSLAINEGTSAVEGAAPTIASIGIDPDGRGGPVDGSDIGAGVFDPVAIHSGRGRGDIPDHLNDWSAASSTGTMATWTGELGTPIPERDLIGAALEGGVEYVQSMIPGSITTLDAVGDIAVDGGPTPYTPDDSPPYGGQPSPDGSGNVLDGFVIAVDDWDEGEVLSFNWFLLGQGYGYGTDAAAAAAITEIPGGLIPIGTALGGNAYGFGTINLQRTAIGATMGPAIFVGNTGMNQSPTVFFDDVHTIPNPANFVGELGAGITAAFANPDDEAAICGFPGGCGTNTELIERDIEPVPESQPLSIFSLGTAVGLAAFLKRAASRRKPRY